MDLLHGRDALDVSLHDSELLEEVELTALLMVAANDAAGPLARSAVDELLGVPRRHAAATIIRQRCGSPVLRTDALSPHPSTDLTRLAAAPAPH
jgi:hypothetical protein